ncbi:hypothetical protein GCK32_013880 [Trichostrongylus colubriformis]|uniref:C-type lectin domain-containing protein n=1 Tax=Trichostrongylus colubriformis TaxID=6319 RepID=A0AAN8IBC2_TRICO
MSASPLLLYFWCLLLVLPGTGSAAMKTEEKSEKNECPRGWTRYDRSRSCFMVLPQRLRWSEAERACAKSGGRLASITDEYENTFVFTPPPGEPLSNHISQRCCVHPGCGQRCSANERCIPDDLNCWWRTCPGNGIGWCLPVP